MRPSDAAGWPQARPSFFERSEKNAGPSEQRAPKRSADERSEAEAPKADTKYFAYLSVIFIANQVLSLKLWSILLKKYKL